MKIYNPFQDIPGVLLSITLILIFHGCGKAEKLENQAPYCDITYPKQEEVFEVGITMPISVNADDVDGQITMVNYAINNEQVNCGYSDSYSYSWNTSTEDTGRYNIKVTVVDNEGAVSVDEIDVNLIKTNFEKEPEAAFNSSQNFVCPNVPIQFTDQSTNNPTSWRWDFGDDSTSAIQNPSHAYVSNGTYTVSLIVTNNNGSDSVRKTDFISVTCNGAETGTVKDYDGNSYSTIKLGSQWWMAENLRTTHYAAGAEIPLVESNSTWTEKDINSKAMCYYNNAINNAESYGALYTWAAAMNGSGGSSSNPSGVQGVCPSGWHMPSDNEWKQLETYLGMSQMAVNSIGHRGTNEGSKLAGHSRQWNAGELKDNAAFGATGFDASPGGGRNLFGSFLYLGSHGAMWTATGFDAASVWGRCLYNSYSSVRRYNCQKEFAFSVRCVKN
jgi:uncharacterized protein (TIGR02145 family)